MTSIVLIEEILRNFFATQFVCSFVLLWFVQIELYLELFIQIDSGCIASWDLFAESRQILVLLLQVTPFIHYCKVALWLWIFRLLLIFAIVRKTWQRTAAKLKNDKCRRGWINLRLHSISGTHAAEEKYVYIRKHLKKL